MLNLSLDVNLSIQKKTKTIISKKLDSVFKPIQKWANIPTYLDILIPNF